jgi:hypothetical protein
MDRQYASLPQSERKWTQSERKRSENWEPSGGFQAAA